MTLRARRRCAEILDQHSGAGLKARIFTSATQSIHALIYWRTGNLQSSSALLMHSKIDSTVRYLGIEVDGAIEIVDKIDI